MRYFFNIVFLQIFQRNLYVQQKNLWRNYIEISPKNVPKTYCEFAEYISHIISITLLRSGNFFLSFVFRGYVFEIRNVNQK